MVSHQNASLGTAQLTAGSLHKSFENLAAPRGVSPRFVVALQPGRDVCMAIHQSSLSGCDGSLYVTGYDQALLRVSHQAARSARVPCSSAQNVPTLSMLQTILHPCPSVLAGSQCAVRS